MKKVYRIVQTEEHWFKLESRVSWSPFWFNEYCYGSSPTDCLKRYREYEERAKFYPKVLGQGSLEELEALFKE